MIKKQLCLLALLGPFAVHAYSGPELLKDCQVAEEHLADRKSPDPYDSVRSTRCLSYVAGVADGYAVGDYLAERVGVRLNAFCLPKNDPELSMRLVRAVVIHVERMPPNATTGTATLVAGAFARAFPCSDSLEPRK